MYKYSVIIPVYNSEDYLRECVESILGQTYGNLEVLLIDDGSQEPTAKLCDKLASEDDRVNAVHQANAGTSAARNTGLKLATGDYVTFMDNDDFWMSRDSLEHVDEHLTANPVDLLMHYARVYHDDTSSYEDDRNTHLQESVDKMDKASALDELIGQGLVLRAVWGKVARTEFVRENDILFPTGMRNEDTAWSSKAIRLAHSVAWQDDEFYAYRKGHAYAQTAKPITKKMVDDLARIILEETSSIESSSSDDHEKHACLAFLAYPYVVWMGQSQCLGLNGSNDEFVTDMDGIGRTILDQARDSTSKKVALSYRVLGRGLTKRLAGRAFHSRYPVQKSEN